MSVIIIITNINKFNELCYSELLLRKKLYKMKKNSLKTELQIPSIEKTQIPVNLNWCEVCDP